MYVQIPQVSANSWAASFTSVRMIVTCIKIKSQQILRHSRSPPPLAPALPACQAKDKLGTAADGITALVDLDLDRRLERFQEDARVLVDVAKNNSGTTSRHRLKCCREK